MVKSHAVQAYGDNQDLVMDNSRFNNHKFVEVLLYILKSEKRQYWVLKALYYAELDHLSNFGRMIVGDHYYAKSGPVPDLTSKLIMAAKGERIPEVQALSPQEVLSVNNGHISPLREPNMDYLSRSEIECIGRSIQKLKQMTIEQIEEESIQASTHADPASGRISFSELLELIPNGTEIREYLKAD